MGPRGLSVGARLACVAVGGPLPQKPHHILGCMCMRATTHEARRCADAAGHRSSCMPLSEAEITRSGRLFCQ
jgi:hypothetical protein